MNERLYLNIRRPVPASCNGPMVCNFEEPGGKDATCIYWIGTDYDAHIHACEDHEPVINDNGREEGHWDRFYSHWHVGKRSDCKVCVP